MKDKEYIESKQGDMELISWPTRMNVFSFVLSLVKMLSEAFHQMDIKKSDFEEMGKNLTEISACIHDDLKLNDKDIAIVLSRITRVAKMSEILQSVDKDLSNINIDDWIKSGGNIRPNA